MSAYLNPIYCLSLKIFMNVPTPRNHIHGMNEPMNPLGARNILGSPLPLTIVNMLLGIFIALILVSQLKVIDWLELDFDHFIHLHLVMYGHTMSCPPMHKCFSYYDIHGMNLSIFWNDLLHLYQEGFHRPCPIKAQCIA